MKSSCCFASLDETYWINYTAASPYGVSTALASTTDFTTFERHIATCKKGHSLSRMTLTGPEGIEPPTAGFGDRCSTN